MNKTITEKELDSLLNFVGYGRLDADIWFLGMEESAANLKTIRDRQKFQQVEDSLEAQNILGLSPNQFEYENLQNAWSGMSEIMLRLEEKPVTPENLHKYRQESLGRSDGSTLLCEFLPLPMPAGTDWAYESLLPDYPSREAYIEWLKPLRFELFRELVNQNLPKVIICFGRQAWPVYQELFKDFKLSPNGDFEMGWQTDTVVILCDHLAGEAMQGKLEDLLRLILENCLAIDTAKPSGPIPLSKTELARQKKEAARQMAAAKRKPTTKHNPADPYCVCAYCLGYEND